MAKRRDHGGRLNNNIIICTRVLLEYVELIASMHTYHHDLSSSSDVRTILLNSDEYEYYL